LRGCISDVVIPFLLKGCLDSQKGDFLASPEISDSRDELNYIAALKDVSRFLKRLRYTSENFMMGHPERADSGGYSVSLSGAKEARKGQRVGKQDEPDSQKKGRPVNRQEDIRTVSTE
jgi:hypothetical protein